MKLSLYGLAAAIALLPAALGQIEGEPDASVMGNLDGESPPDSAEGSIEGEQADANMNFKRAPQCGLTGQHKNGLKIEAKKNTTLAECLSACQANRKCMSVQIAVSGSYKGTCNLLSANTANARINPNIKAWVLYDRDCTAPYECPKCPSSAPLCTLNLHTRQPKCCPAGKPVANNAGCYPPNRVICNNTQIWAPGSRCPCAKK